MHSTINSKDVLKWTVIALKAVAVTAALIPQLKASFREPTQRHIGQSPPMVNGHFGLIFLDKEGAVTTRREFSRSDVRVGHVDKYTVQQAAIEANASSAVLTYESPGLVVDNPSTYRSVIRDLHLALTEIDVRLLNRESIESQMT